MQAIGQLHEDDADVIHHRQQHLPEVLGLPLFARREGDGTDLGYAFDDMRHFGPEQFVDPLDAGEGVFDDVVEEAGGHGDDVELEIGQEVGHLERMHHVGLARVAHLSLVLEGGEDVRPPQQLEVCLRAVAPHFLDKILEANHGLRCLTH